MANKKISELPTGSTPTGPELVEAVQGGVNVKLTAQEIADLGTSGLTEADLTASRTVTTTDATIQDDNLNIIYADSATPFDIAVELLTIGTQITVINIGAATVTLTQGAGVTLPGTTVPILSGTNVTIIYRIPATPDIYSSVVDPEWGAITGTITDQLDLVAYAAPLASPTFTGTPAAPTAAQGTNTTQLATTAFVKAEIDIVKNLINIGGMGMSM